MRRRGSWNDARDQREVLQAVGAGIKVERVVRRHAVKVEIDADDGVGEDPVAADRHGIARAGEDPAVERRSPARRCNAMTLPSPAPFASDGCRAVEDEDAAAGVSQIQGADDVGSDEVAAGSTGLEPLSAWIPTPRPPPMTLPSTDTPAPARIPFPFPSAIVSRPGSSRSGCSGPSRPGRIPQRRGRRRRWCSGPTAEGPPTVTQGAADPDAGARGAGENEDRPVAGGVRADEVAHSPRSRRRR